MTQRAAFIAAGALWACLGVLAILTIFGTVGGLTMAWLVGVRRSVTAARVGAVLGLVLLVPFQLVLDVTGCRHDACGPGPYLIADGLPMAVVALNLAAGWRRPAPPTPAGDGAALETANDPLDAGLQEGAGI